MADPANTSNTPENPQDNPKHAGGRPVKWTEKRAIDLAEEMLSWIKKDTDDDFHISIEVFLVEVKNLRPSIIRDLSDKYEQFTQIVQDIKRFQAEKIANLALKNKVNGRYAQFYQSAQHGWAAQTKVEQTGSLKLEGGGGINITYEVVPNQNIQPK